VYAFHQYSYEVRERRQRREREARAERLLRQLRMHRRRRRAQLHAVLEKLLAVRQRAAALR
jgi:hypothetical protein